MIDRKPAPQRVLILPTNAERAAGRLMRAPDHGDAGGGAGGGDAGAGTGAGAAAGDVADVFGGSGGGDAGAGAGAGAGEGAQAGADGKWAEIFSADPLDAETPSHREWLTKKGFKTADDLVKSYRETEKALRSGDRVAIPKEGASPEDVAAYRAARGVPEKPEDYAFSLPDGVTGELNEDLVGSFRQAAHKAGLSATEAAQLVKDWYIPLQMDMETQQVAARNAERDAKFKEWGQAKDANVALCNRAAAKFGFNGTDVANVQAAIGTARTLDFFKTLGDGMAEDAMIDGGRGKFGITVAEAKTQKDAMLADRETAQKIRDKDPATVQRLDRLQNIIAADLDQKQGRRAA